MASSFSLTRTMTLSLFFALSVASLITVTSSQAQNAVNPLTYDRQAIFVKPQNFQKVALGNRTRFTAEEKDLILRLHNSYRSLVEPPAFVMRELVWDTDLEDFAWNHTQACTGAHSDRKMVKKWKADPNSWDTWYLMGENLYWAYGGMYSIEQAMWMFWEEGKDYDIETRNCTHWLTCAHYRVLVTAASYRVGCAINVCKNFSKSKYPGPASLMSCSYNGMYLDSARPYTVGPSCQGCTRENLGYDFQYCRNRLCISPAQKFEKTGFDGNTTVVGLQYRNVSFTIPTTAGPETSTTSTTTITTEAVNETTTTSTTEVMNVTTTISTTEVMNVTTEEPTANTTANVTIITTEEPTTEEVTTVTTITTTTAEISTENATTELPVTTTIEIVNTTEEETTSNATTITMPSSTTESTSTTTPLIIISSTTSEVYPPYVIKGYIRIIGGYPWTSVLLDPDNPETKVLAMEMRRRLAQAFAELDEFEQIDEIEFSEGSIVVVYTAIFNSGTNVTPELMTATLKSYVMQNNLKLGAYLIDYDSIEHSVVPPKEEEEKLLPDWAIAAIVCGTLVFILVVTLVVVLCCRRGSSLNLVVQEDPDDLHYKRGSFTYESHGNGQRPGHTDVMYDYVLDCYKLPPAVDLDNISIEKKPVVVLRDSMNNEVITDGEDMPDENYLRVSAGGSQRSYDNNSNMGTFRPGSDTNSFNGEWNSSV